MTSVLMIAPLNAANFESGNAPAGTVLTANGAGGASMEAPVAVPYLHSHDLSNITDAGSLASKDTVAAGDVDSGAAANGSMLTADGSGGASWQPASGGGGGGESFPVGTILQAPSSPGAKWLEMTNVEVNRADYAELSTVVPTLQFNGPPSFVSSTLWNANPFPVWNGTTWCTVVYGGTKSYLSPDGVTWTEYSGSIVTARNWSSIWWTGNQWVVLAYGTKYALTSPDGITWTERDITITSGRCVVNTGNKLIISSAYSNIGRQSNDGGVTWTSYTFPFSFSNDANLYKQPDVQRIWACNGGTLAFSEDEGATWTQRTSKWDSRYMGNQLSFYYLGFRGSRVYAGAYDRIVYSDDLGVTWIGLPFPAGISASYPIVFVPSTGTEIYTSQPMAYSSDDGASWVCQNQINVPGTSNPWFLGVDSVGPLYRLGGVAGGFLSYFIRPYQSTSKIWLRKPNITQWGNSSWLKTYIKALP